MVWEMWFGYSRWTQSRASCAKRPAATASKPERLVSTEPAAEESGAVDPGAAPEGGAPESTAPTATPGDAMERNSRASGKAPGAAMILVVIVPPIIRFYPAVASSCGIDADRLDRDDAKRHGYVPD